MKKLIALFMALTLLLASACAAGSQNNPTQPDAPSAGQNDPAGSPDAEPEPEPEP